MILQTAYDRKSEDQVRPFSLFRDCQRRLSVLVGLFRVTEGTATIYTESQFCFCAVLLQVGYRVAADPDCRIRSGRLAQFQ